MIAAAQSALGLAQELGIEVIEIAGLTRAALLDDRGLVMLLLPLGLSREATERQIGGELFAALREHLDHGALLRLLRGALAYARWSAADDQAAD